ncbi:Glycosyltransferase involved in cell wall bisynthesis [Paenibacillus sp. UNCCL117]|uniref:glycosyltransferase n=1 Tax=unclassified Paenibacillus TaxID=185978 RepID=UPI000880E952|nr:MULTISPECIES: glycosyltransferase [unclassified Paenibacillus]SDC03106.1 Glycosyltransferase involved in cell wall bisynthesis [Paenibacillus sp. cl123]SFW37001.1 Glycosyltransferase involved in cell wall bisynthesis [Paenibacillus sp. UNCCL117]
MNIAFYNHTSVVSGAEISLLLTAANLPHSRAILFAPEGELTDRAEAMGIRVVRIPGYRARMSKNPLRLAKDMIGMLWAGHAFARSIKAHGIDLIHANSLRAGIMAALFIWLHRKPLVWHVRDNPPQGMFGRAIGFVARQTTSALICISQAVKEGFQGRRLDDRLHLIHNGVSLKEFDEAARKEHRRRLREELDTPQDAAVLAIIGQIAPWKRQEDAIHALKHLRKSGHQAILWIVGEAKFRQENKDYWDFLHKLAEEFGLQDAIRFTGFREDVMEICSAADLLLLCSDHEPFGRVLIEAMSQSIPVVGTNAGGVPEIVVHDSCGLLYPVGDVNALTLHANKLLQSPALRISMGRRAAARVREAFTIQDTARKVEALYETIVPGRRARSQSQAPGAADSSGYALETGGGKEFSR